MSDRKPSLPPADVPQGAQPPVPLVHAVEAALGVPQPPVPSQASASLARAVDLRLRRRPQQADEQAGEEAAGAAAGPSLQPSDLEPGLAGIAVDLGELVAQSSAAGTATGAAGATTGGGAAAGATLAGGSMVGAVAALAALAAIAVVAGGGSSSGQDPAADTTPPGAPTIAVSGTTVTLTYNETLGSLTAEQLNTLRSSFAVQVNGVGNAVTAVAVADRTVTLTLTSAVPQGANVQIAYTDPTAGNDAVAVQDAAGNDAGSFATGVVSDGYIRGAQIYVDVNKDGVAQEGEKLTGVLTDARGNFVLPASAPKGPVIAVGGVNIDTGVPNTMVLKTPEGSTVITPLTTLVQEVIQKNPTATVAAASTAVQTALGITLPAGRNLTTFDPLAALATDGGDANALGVQKAAVQVATIVALAAADPAGTQTASAAAAAVVGKLVTQIGSVSTPNAVDLTSAAVLTQVLAGASDTAAGDIAAQTDAIGKQGNLASVIETQAMALDKIKPAAPTGLALAPASDGGTQGDLKTNDDTPTVRVSIEKSALDGTAVVEGDKVRLLLGSDIVGVAVVSAADVARGYVDVTPTQSLGAGAKALTAVAIDKADNESAASSAVTFTVDTVKPTAEIALSDPALKAGESSTVTVTFSEAVIGFEAADLSTPNGTLSAVVSSDGGITWTGTFTPAADTDDATNAVSLGTGYTDVAGNAGNAADSPNYVVETRLPTATVVVGSESLKTGQTAAVTVTFSEPVTGLTESDFTVGSGTLSGLQTADEGKTWTATLTPAADTEDATNTVSLALAGVADLAGNAGSGAQPSGNYAVDTRAPTVTSTALSAAENGTAVGTLTASEAVSWKLGEGGDTASFSLSGSTLSFQQAQNFEGGKTSYTVKVEATDTAGNVSARDVTVTLTDVNEAPTPQGSVTARTAVKDQGFTLNLAGFFADVDAGSNGTLGYTLAAGSSLPAGLSLNASTGVISGTATAVAAATDVTVRASDGGNPSLSAEQRFSIGVVAAPVVQGFSVADNAGSMATAGRQGEALSFSVMFSEPVTVSGGTPTITFAMGGRPVVATYQAGSGSAALTFSGTAPAGDGTTTMLEAIDLNGATVTGTLSTQPWQTTVVGQSFDGYVLDNTAPTVGAAISMPENSTAPVALSASESASFVLGSGGQADLFSLSGSALSLKTAKNFETETVKTYTVNVSATDAVGNAATQAVTVTLSNVNEAPTAEGSVADQVAAVGQAYSLNLAPKFSDVDADTTFSYSLSSGTPLPAGLSLDGTTGVISGTASAAAAQASVTVVASDGALSASQTFNLAAVVAPTFSSTLDGVGNFDVTSNIVITVSQAVTAVPGKFIRIVNDGGPGHNGEATVNTQQIDAKDVTIVNNTIQINPQFDLDFANNYHVEIDAGAFKASGVDSVAVNDSTTLNFTTVTPSAGATAAPSVKMAGSDAMVASLGWWEAEGNGTPPPGQPVTRDFSGGDFALVATDLGASGIATDDFYIKADNFGVGDRLYFDNRGSNASVRQSDFDNGMIVDLGEAPTQVVSGASGTATGQGGGQIDVNLAGSPATFDSVATLQLLLGGGTVPVTYLPIMHG